jgi:lipopolysaccharide/colanic/teichoic acid biosynthesis glycosyltransferase
MDPRDFIYSKTCLGKEGKPITICKFRSMIPDADKQLDKIPKDCFDSNGHITDDPRVTPLGKIFRRYWIDELPQLYNFMAGDLKLVGIRPRSESDWKTYPPEIKERSLRQKPGLMGIQYAYLTTNSFDDTISHMAEYLDLWDKDPSTTDDMYLSRILKNIIFKGIRSR